MIEETVDVRVVGIVVVREAERQLEATRPDELAQCLETRLDAPALPAGDRRLRPADRAPELGLRQARAKASFS